MSTPPLPSNQIQRRLRILVIMIGLCLVGSIAVVCGLLALWNKIDGISSPAALSHAILRGYTVLTVTFCIAQGVVLYTAFGIWRQAKGIRSSKPCS